MTAYRSLLARLAMVLGATLLAGCAANTESTDTAETVPASITIRDLTLTPTTIPAGAVSTLSGNVEFDAPNDDVTQIAVDVSLPNGTTQTLPTTDVPSARGIRSGPLAIALLLGPPTAGSYVVSVRLIDAKGSPSNTLTTTVEAE